MRDLVHEGWICPGPDGLPVAFFQKFWTVIHPVVMPLFHEFYIGSLDMSCLNYAIISLIPKVFGATNIRHFRPIALINVLEQIFAKVCATHLSPVAERIAHPLQSAFLKGRRIHEGSWPCMKSSMRWHRGAIRAYFLSCTSKKPTIG